MDKMLFIRIGIISLSAVLFYFANKIQSKEKSASSPRKIILLSTKVFKLFLVAIITLGIIGQIIDFASSNRRIKPNDDNQEINTK